MNAVSPLAGISQLFTDCSQFVPKPGSTMLKSLYLSGGFKAPQTDRHSPDSEAFVETLVAHGVTDVFGADRRVNLRGRRLQFADVKRDSMIFAEFANLHYIKSLGSVSV